ncbi:hypothetical protein GUITHDRAFT_103729 [Guillardia theta CCMP2712]|uniref:Uncharacterized protein n=1 Tax=Guillardia theta (strain CCMP2712) TaxID=905079 RepID=L1JQY2_GUITC|nr:hypothetical protein GUITHDRAFT_103729 [Guillardia theta CCMP2712]EKX50498.1 hypothetical protein GUITHDRAFT_103729 [Guillardia theta CCMP2712]|mmetsp:Transcript_49837/g.155953  ORF Transcript_49837/g.155953 Transcript_49837/m.155953 type:complete len:190 (+) Transcript_49837:130-699(+)|eukprot:XP_005837478.1 hypothetical protein GUITHDRAFT_103729 [Guillardia theta CCMP2712]
MSVEGKLSSAGLEGFGLCFACCSCIFFCMMLSWIIFVIVTMTSSPIPAPCKAFDYEYFPQGGIYDFILYYLVLIFLLPCVFGCLYSISGRSSALGIGFRMLYLMLTIYVMAWGVMMWRSIDPQCSAEYEKPEFQNLFFVFQVQVVLSVLNGFGSFLELLGLPFRSAGFSDSYTQIDEKAPQNPETEGFV